MGHLGSADDGRVRRIGYKAKAALDRSLPAMLGSARTMDMPISFGRPADLIVMLQ
jgi:hypothetical protein